MHKEWDGGRIQNKVTPFFESCIILSPKESLEDCWRIATLEDVHFVQTTAQSKAPMHQSWILMTGSIVLTADVAIGKLHVLIMFCHRFQSMCTSRVCQEDWSSYARRRAFMLWQI